MANPPPPYDNITGITRAVMKDNSQVTLANYDGNARPGELVVNLETNPPALYVGNNAGQLTAVSSGNNVNAVTVDVTNTNGIDTNYSITFVENRDATQILRADVDLRFNSATNLLTVGNISTGSGSITGGNVNGNVFNGNVAFGLGTIGGAGNISAGNISAIFTMQLAVYANTTVRDSSITSPAAGMMIYVTGTGMQVRGATSWNTIAGSGT